MCDTGPFFMSLLVEFRKWLNEIVLAEINEMIIEYNKHTARRQKVENLDRKWKAPYKIGKKLCKKDSNDKWKKSLSF